MQLALCKETNDLMLPEDGGVYRVEEGRFVVQQVQNKLKTLLGEWILDEDVGYISLDDLRKNYNLSDLEVRLMSIVINTQGVLSIDSVDMNYSNRVLDINFTATTIYGKIDSTIPWVCGVAQTAPFDPNVAVPVTHLGIPVTFNGQIVYHS